MSDDTLKLCPFCGKDAHESPDNCPCNTHLYNMTRKDWNTRPIEDALRAELAAAQAREAKLRTALEWYAQNRIDDGGRARAALAEKLP